MSRLGPVPPVGRAHRAACRAGCPHREQRVEVDAVVRVPMADQHGVDRVDGAVAQQAGQGDVTGIDRQPESAVMDGQPLHARTAEGHAPQPPRTVSRMA